MIRSTFYPSVSTPINDIESNTVDDLEKINNATSERNVTTRDARAHEVQDVLARSIVTRMLAPAMARIEIHSTQLVCMAVDKSLTAAGNIAVRLGAACLKAGERAHNATKPPMGDSHRDQAHQHASIEVPRKAD